MTKKKPVSIELGWQRGYRSTPTKNNYSRKVCSILVGRHTRAYENLKRLGFDYLARQAADDRLVHKMDNRILSSLFPRQHSAQA